MGAQRQVWVKGLALSGVVTRSAGTNGLRVGLDGMVIGTRRFLKFVQESTRVTQRKQLPPTGQVRGFPLKITFHLGAIHAAQELDTLSAY